MTDENSTKKKGMLVIDLGSHKRKLVKNLKRGEGKLARDVESTVDELRASGAVDGKAQVIVVVVKEKAKKRSGVSALPVPFIPVR